VRRVPEWKKSFDESREGARGTGLGAHEIKHEDTGDRTPRPIGCAAFHPVVAGVNGVAVFDPLHRRAVSPPR
jgi:hypothetical protein